MDRFWDLTNFFTQHIKNYIRFGKSDGNCDELFLAEDMLFFDDMYYSNWSVFSTEVLRKSMFRVTSFEHEKAELPKKENS